MTISESDMKYLCCLNVLGTEMGYHNVGIWMFAHVKKADHKPINNEPHKHTDWTWHKWDKFVEYKPLFIPFEVFFK